MSFFNSEVVRAEIKARMRSCEKIKSAQEMGISKLGSNIEAVRNESAARLEGAMKSLVGRADIVDEKIENVQEKIVKKAPFLTHTATIGPLVKAPKDSLVRKYSNNM